MISALALTFVLGAAIGSEPTTFPLVVRRVTEWIAAESGLSTLHATAVETVTEEDLSVAARQAVGDPNAEADRNAMLTAFGVLSDGADSLAALYAERVASGVCYDSESDRLLFTNRAGSGDPAELVATIATACFDQVVDLGEFRSAHDKDAALARELCFAGFVEFVTRRTILAHSPEIVHLLPADSPWPRPLEERLAARDAEPFVIERAGGIRRAGLRFVERVHAEFGADGLRRILASPPRSSEQVLFPERWLGIETIDEPAAVEARDLVARLPAGARVVHETALGAFESELVLRLGGDPVRATIAVDGFDGDALVMYEVGETRLLQWRIECDEESDAIGWMLALRKLCERRLVNPVVAKDAPTPETIELRLDDAKQRLEARRADDGLLRAIARRDGATVEFLLAPTGALDLEALIAR
jgi:hypothetical protein